MKRNPTIRLIALISMLICLASAPAQALAHTTKPGEPRALAATSSAGGAPFSSNDLVALAVGASCLLALGVGFRRVSARLE